MKQKLVLLILWLGFLPPLISQSVEIIPYTGYHWGGKLKFYDGEIRFNSSQNYGIAMDVNLDIGATVHLEYLNQPTDLDVRFYSELGPEFKKYPVNMNWFQVGGLKQLDLDQLQPFGGIGLGALYFNPRTNEIQEAWKFAMTAQVGLKYFINDKIGIRAHIRMLMPIQWAGFGFYFGSGGSGTSVNAGSYIIQGDVGAGLIFRLGS